MKVPQLYLAVGGFILAVCLSGVIWAGGTGQTSETSEESGTATPPVLPDPPGGGGAGFPGGLNPFLHCFGRAGCPADGGPESPESGGEEGGDEEGGDEDCEDCGDDESGDGGEAGDGDEPDDGGSNGNPFLPWCPCAGTSSGGNSYVDNSFYNYNHWATDIPKVGGSSVELVRYFRSRDLFVAGSFGQGFLCSFDFRLQVSDTGGSTDLDDVLAAGPCHLRLPHTSAALNFSFGQNNVFNPTHSYRSGTLEILDAQMQAAVSPTNDQHFPGAQYARLKNSDGSEFVFELVMARSTAGWDPNVTHPVDGRLISARNRDGEGYDITYKTWTQTEIDQSPSRLWQMDTVTDAMTARTLTMSYDSVQHAGAWVLSQITDSAGGQWSYSYGGGFLSSITLPDSAVSTFDFQDASNGLVDMVFEDLSADPQHRRKTATFAGAVSTINGRVVPTSIGMARAVKNAEGEYSYFNFVVSEGGGSGTYGEHGYEETGSGIEGDAYYYSAIYSGGGRMYLEVTYDEHAYNPQVWIPKLHLEDGWTFDTDNGTVTLTGKLEESYEKVATDSFVDFLNNRPDSIQNADGTVIEHQYDNAKNRIYSKYSDGTIEAFCYNSQNLVTRKRDRLGNVTRWTYDSDGRVLTKQVGLVDAASNQPSIDQYGGAIVYNRCATNDVATSEAATWTWTYHPTGTNGAGKLATTTDPLGNVTSYAYDSAGRLTTKTYPPLTGGAAVVETRTYDSHGRLATITNPAGHQKQFVYDTQHRLISTLYDDGSTEVREYGSNASANGYGLLVKSINRVGVVTTYDYDAADRVIEKVVAAAVIDSNSVEVATPEIASTITYAYVSGTDDVREVVQDGSATRLVYDYRGRPVETIMYADTATRLTTQSVYHNHRLICSVDAYDRKTYYAYDATDGRLIRTVKGTVPEFEVALTDPNDPAYDPFTAILNLVRDNTANADYVIYDSVYDAGGNLAEVYDGKLVKTEYEYDSRNRQTAAVAASGTTVSARTETDYDLVSNVTAVRSPRYFDATDTTGHQKDSDAWTYTAARKVASHTVAPGTPEAATESFTYDVLGRRITHTDFAGKVWKTHFENCCGQVVASEDPLGHASIARTNAAGQSVHIASVEDYTTHVSALDNPVDAKTLREATMLYDGRGRPQARTVWLTARGVVDSSSPPIAGFGSVPTADGATEQYLFDDDLTDGVGLDSATGVSVQQLDQGGSYNVSLATALTKLADTTANGGAAVSFGTDSTGSAVVTINAEEEVSFTISDSLGRAVMEGSLVPYTGTTPNDLLVWNCTIYDATSNVSGYGTCVSTQQVDSLGYVKSELTDACGRRIQYSDQGGAVQTFDYDASGNLLSSAAPGGATQSFTYDELSRTLSTTDPTNKVRQSEYNSAGQLVKQIDAKGKDIKRNYDSRGRLVSLVDRTGATVQFTYTSNGKVATVTDRSGSVTTYARDDVGNLLSETLPDHVTGTQAGDSGFGMVTYTFDALGRPISREDQQGDLVTLEYDLAGQMTEREYQGAAGGPLAGLSSSDTFTFDKVGRMLTAVSGPYSNTVTFTYDEVGRKATESVALLGQTYQTTAAYNSRSELTSITYPGGTVVQRSYHPAGELNQVTRAGQSVDQRTYDTAGRLNSSSLGNGVSTTWQYNADSFIAVANTTHPAGVSQGLQVGTYQFTYDANKNKTAATIAGVSTAINDLGIASMSHDDEDRIVGLTRTGGTTEAWSYSSSGDWNSSSRDGVQTSRVHNAAHETTSIGGASLTYDTKGNLTLDATVSPSRGFDWGVYHLDGVDTDGDGTADQTFTYDAIGRRIGVTESSTTQVAVPFGNQSLKEYEISGGSSVAGREYFYGSYVDEMIATYDSALSEMYYYHLDDLYSVIAVTDDTGTVVERYAYDGFGNCVIFDPVAQQVINNSLIDANRRFTGQEFSDSTGIGYYRSRYYDPDLGRFLSRDPAVTDLLTRQGLSPFGAMTFDSQLTPSRSTRGGDALSMLASSAGMSASDSPLFQEVRSTAAYSYVNNAPNNMTDPNGQSWILIYSSCGLPICSAAVICAGNAGASSVAIICSGNVGACSAGLICSGSAGGACSGGLVCSGTLSGGACSASVFACSGQTIGACSGSVTGGCSLQAAGACSGQAAAAAACSGQATGACSANIGIANVCSAQAMGYCSGQAAAATVCSGQLIGLCSGQAGGMAVCSGQFIAGGCSAQVTAIGGNVCSATKVGVCSSIQIGNNNVCSGMVAGACSAQVSVGNNNICSGVVAAFCSGQTGTGSNNYCSTTAHGPCSGQHHIVPGTNICSGAGQVCPCDILNARLEVDPSEALVIQALDLRQITAGDVELTLALSASRLPEESTIQLYVEKDGVELAARRCSGSGGVNRMEMPQALLRGSQLSLALVDSGGSVILRTPRLEVYSSTTDQLAIRLPVTNPAATPALANATPAESDSGRENGSLSNGRLEDEESTTLVRKPGSRIEARESKEPQDDHITSATDLKAVRRQPLLLMSVLPLD